MNTSDNGINIETRLITVGQKPGFIRIKKDHSLVVVAISGTGTIQGPNKDIKFVSRQATPRYDCGKASKFQIEASKKSEKPLKVILLTIK